jgi:hypothetical protein
MTAVSLIALAAFGSALCITEIPKMLKAGLRKELIVFLLLLALGMALAVMKLFNIGIPNPTDFIVWVYSPISGIMKWLAQSQ